ncbi:hypothetical protein II898_04280 [bacterium]|nr:hypothetical protein [bacterium]
MKERIWNEIKEFLACAFVGLLIGLAAGWACARDIDKDVKRECGMKRFDNAPEYCVQWWDANEVE